MKIYATEIEGTPRPQGSMQAMVNKNTGTAFVKYGDTTVQHRNAVIAQVAREWDGAPCWGDAVAISVEFVFPRPKTHFGTGKNADVLKAVAPVAHVKTPDVDKLLRLICDAVDIAGVVGDDSQFTIARGEKRYAVKNEQPKTIIEIWSA